MTPWLELRKKGVGAGGGRWAVGEMASGKVAVAESVDEAAAVG